MVPTLAGVILLVFFLFNWVAGAVLVNTAIAIGKNPSKIAEAFKLATIAGRLSYLYRGRRVQGNFSIKANASSPLTGFLNEEERVS